MIRPLIRLIILTLGCSLYINQAQAQGLKPLQPSEFSSRSLHFEPAETSPILREITDQDRLTILRSERDWYEVDIQTPENLTFHGWLRGTLAPERLPPPPAIEGVAKKEDPRPLASTNYLWFWDSEAKDISKIDLHLGGQVIFYTMNGVVSNSKSKIYSYDFSGLSLGLAAELALLKTHVWNRPFSWTLEGSYFYGLYGLSFGSDFAVQDLRGVGYRIDTHTYRVQSFGKYYFFDTDSNAFSVGLGLGFYSHEVAPDLQPVRGGTFANQLVFVQTSLQGLTTPLQLDGKVAHRWLYRLTFAPILFADLSETGTQTPNLDSSGFPFLATAQFGYEWTNYFSTLIELEQLKAAGSATATGLSRLGTDFSNPEIDFSYIRGTLAARFKF